MNNIPKRPNLHPEFNEISIEWCSTLEIDTQLAIFSNAQKVGRCYAHSTDQIIVEYGINASIEQEPTIKEVGYTAAVYFTFTGGAIVCFWGMSRFVTCFCDLIPVNSFVRFWSLG